MDFDSLYKIVQPYTLLSRNKLFNLYNLAQLVNKQNIPGDFLECGTWNGGSAAVLAAQLKDRTLWMFDSFEGMPPVDPIDGEGAREYVGSCVGDPEKVRQVIEQAGVDAPQYRICQGMFENTFLTEIPDRVAILHCDCDWYRSVSLTLETFYTRIPQGGAVILDDFGYWEGCREAFYDFCRAHNERPLVERIDRDQLYWIKGRMHNRTE